MPPDPHEGQEPPVDPRPYLSIPYWSSPLPGAGPWDDGSDRPLPGAVVSYLCDSIHAGPYQPGQPLTVSVDVRNAGDGTADAVALVTVYWAIPTASFGSPKFLCAASVSVPPTRTTPGSTRTATMTGTIPSGAPDHVCLLVRVSHPLDPAGPTPDPVGDRHWAQRNLVAVTNADAEADVAFQVSNPFDEDLELAVLVEPEFEERAAVVARAVHREPLAMLAVVHLADVDGEPLTDEGERVEITVYLERREQRTLRLRIRTDAIPAGTCIPLQVVSRPTSSDTALGSLGVVLLGAD